MDPNQQLIVLLLIGAIAYYYLANEQTSTGTGKTGTGTGTSNDDDKNKLNEIKGYRPNTTSFLTEEVDTLQACYDLAEEKEAIGYTYTTSTHEDENKRKKCRLHSSMGVGEMQETEHHYTGCVNTSQDPSKGCLNYMLGFGEGGSPMSGVDNWDGESIGNVTLCRDLASVSNAKGYVYRKGNHNSLPQTCLLLSSMPSSSSIQDTGMHITGCSDITKTLETNCE